MAETLVFMDAGFISKLSKYLGNGDYLKFDFYKLSKLLAKKSNLYCKHIFYYTAPPFQSNNPSIDERRRKERYDKFVSSFKDSKSISIKEGRVQRLKENVNYIYKQKGVDTHLTMDLMKVPLDFKNIKKIILIASDSDFVPTINELKKYDVKVILYTYFDKNRKSRFSTSNELKSTVGECLGLTKEDFINSSFSSKK